LSDMTAPRPMVPAFTGIYDAFEPLALPLLRFVLGMILVPHGCQKLFGWFGGMGFEKFTELFDKLGWHPAVFWLSLVAATEFLGGLMLAFCFLTRFAAVRSSSSCSMRFGSPEIPADFSGIRAGWNTRS
jgi:putative oxidoreductase